MLVPPTTLRLEPSFSRASIEVNAYFIYAAGGRVIVREDLVLSNADVVHAAIFLDLAQIEVFTEEEWNKYDSPAYLS